MSFSERPIKVAMLLLGDSPHLFCHGVGHPLFVATCELPEVSVPSLHVLLQPLGDLSPQGLHESLQFIHDENSCLFLVFSGNQE